MGQLSKVKRRRQATRRICKETLAQIVSGEIEIYVGYRRLYGQWCGNNAAAQELRPMFRIPGIEPDGKLPVTNEFKTQVISIARDILPHFSD